MFDKLSEYINSTKTFHSKFGQRGATVSELIVGLFMTSLIIHSTIVGTSAVHASIDRNTTRTAIEGVIARARSVAIEEGAYTIISSDQDGTQISMGIDRAPFSSPPVADEELTNLQLPTNVAASFPGSIRFDSRGIGVDETGIQQNLTMYLMQNNNAFCSGTLYPLGRVDFQC